MLLIPVTFKFNGLLMKKKIEIVNLKWNYTSFKMNPELKILQVHPGC